MASQAVERQETSAGGNGAVAARLTLLFVLSTTAAGEAVQGMLRALLARGHAIFVALEGPRNDAADALASLDALRADHPGLQYRLLPESRHLWLYPATAVRRRLDHLRSLEPGLDAASPFGDRPPPIFRLVLFLPPFRWQSGRRALAWVLERLEAAMPMRGSVRDLIGERSPNRLLISPLVDFGSAQVDYLRAAHAAGTPSVWVVAGRDDLTAKGGLRELPTLTLAWNEAQAEAAVRTQGVPPERVVAAGLGDETPPAGAAEAVERVREADVVKSRRGMLLRPLLWLLTPVLAVLMPLLRPRATARAASKAVSRLGKRIRAARHRRRREAQLRAKLKAHEAKLKQREEAMAAKLEAKAQAEATKRAFKEREEAAKRAFKEREEAAKAAMKSGRAPEAADTPEPGSEAPGAKDAKPAKAKRAAAKATKQSGAKAAGGGRGGRRLARMRKRARGRAKALRRRWKHTRRGVRRVYNRRWRFTYGKTITRVPARDELPALLNARNLLGRGVEIGVKTGVYSDELLSNWHGKELISVDPWLSADPDEYVDRSNVSQDEFEDYYRQTQERLSKHGSRSTIWRMTSVEAAPKIPDHELDFVYVDARHDYDSVLEDLDAWCTKVKPGGILAGHDYVDGDLPQGEFYVKSAVDEFFGARGIPVHSTEGPSVVEMFPTWIVEVPEEGIRPAEGAGSGDQDAEAERPSEPATIRGGDE